MSHPVTEVSGAIFHISRKSCSTCTSTYLHTEGRNWFKDEENFLVLPRVLLPSALRIVGLEFAINFIEKAMLPRISHNFAKLNDFISSVWLKSILFNQVFTNREPLALMDQPWESSESY